MSRMTKIKEKIKKTFNDGGFTLVLFIYSGHGIEMDSHTWAVMGDGQHINLKKFVQECAQKKNTLILAAFDCCRELEESKSKKSITRVTTKMID